MSTVLFQPSFLDNSVSSKTEFSRNVHKAINKESIVLIFQDQELLCLLPSLLFCLLTTGLQVISEEPLAAQTLPITALSDAFFSSWLERSANRNKAVLWPNWPSFPFLFHRGYCSRRLRRLRKTLNFKMGNRHKFTGKKVTEEILSDNRYGMEQDGIGRAVR